MAGESAERIERLVDRTAAALFAAAAAYGAHAVSLRLVPSLAPALAICAIAYVLCWHLLTRVQPEQLDFPAFRFHPAELPAPELGELLLTELTELVLTDADRVNPVTSGAADELVLDDILAQLGPDSRVVRLFDPAAMPTPGQLKSQIDRHLHATTPSPIQDASQALHEALAELRRSLR